MSKGSDWRDVLRYSGETVDRSKIRRAYARYRKETGLTDRCDNPVCQFHTDPLVWNTQPLPLIVDHVDGVKNDNRPEKLRYLCPNCDSQLATRGGRNKGRVTVASGGFAIKRPDGKKDHVMPAETGVFRIG